MRKRLTASGRFHLPLATVFADVARLGEISIARASFVREFLAVGPEFVRELS